jgi:hypothetical protein
MDVLETCLPQHLCIQRGGLRRTVATSIVIATTGLLIGPLMITIIIFRPLRGIIDSGGGYWCWVDSSGSSREFCAGRLLIRCLFFFIGVIEDYDHPVTRLPEDVMVEVTKKFPSKLRVARSASDEVFLIQR